MVSRVGNTGSTRLSILGSFRSVLRDARLFNIGRLMEKTKIRFQLQTKEG